MVFLGVLRGWARQEDIALPNDHHLSQQMLDHLDCSFAGRIDPIKLTRPPGPRKRGDSVVRPFEPQLF
jgi:hypothetical protein